MENEEMKNNGGGFHIHVYSSGNNVAGTINQNYYGQQEKRDTNVTIPNEELFKFIHPAVHGEQELVIHNEVKSLVTRQKIQEICKYLDVMVSKNEILLPQRAEITYSELVRMGMPNGEGYNIKTFMKYYRK